MPKRILYSKKKLVPVVVAVAEPEPTPVLKPKRILKRIKPVLSAAPVLQVAPVALVVEAKPSPDILPSQPKPRRILGKPRLPIPPIPGPSDIQTKAMEAFESIREYYTQRGLPIPQSDIVWFNAELKREKDEYDEFWARCASTKACIEGTLRGDDDWTITLAMNAARQLEKKMPILDTDIGPMPDYGTVEFWAWCHKRKKLKEQKEAAIIAAGGTVPVPKQKKVAKVKMPKA
jgi:hypothetical protein